MSMRPIKKGSTDESVNIRIIDSTDGTPEEGVDYDTSGLSLWYRREGGTKVAITPAALAALDSAHADGGIEHVDDGYYRLDAPDAAFAAGANGVLFGGTVTDMIVIGCYVHLTDYDPQDVVRLGLTALPNAAADAAGGLPISDAGGLDLDTLLARLDAAISTRSSHDAAAVKTAIEVAGSHLALIKAVTDALPGTLTTIGEYLDTEIADILEDTGTTLSNLLTAISGFVDDLETRLTADRASKLDNLDALVSSRSSHSATDVKAAIEAVGSHLALILADTGELQTDWHDGGRLDVILDAIKAVTDALTLTAAAIADAVWDESISGHLGAGSTGAALNAVAVPAGDRSVTVTVDDGSDPVPDVEVSIFNSDESAYITGGTTDSNGQVSTALDDGTYKVRLRKAGYTFSSPGTLTVSGDTDETFSMTAVTISTPDTSDQCVVYEWCFAPNGETPLASVTATAKIVNVPYDYADKLHGKAEVTGTYDSETGKVEWTLVREAEVEFKIVELGLAWKKTIPDAASARLQDLDDA